MNRPTRLRVLVLAEACNPDWPSVPLIGWRGTEALSKVAEVHLVTQVRNRDAIRARAPSWPCTFIDTEDIAGPLHRLSTRLRGGPNRSWTLNSLLSSIGYMAFERRAWDEFGHRLRLGHFDVVHRLTPVSPGFGGSFARRCAKIGVPFVLGPINGGVRWPAAFATERAREGERLGRLRYLQRLLPWYGSTRRSASAILVGSTVALDDLPPRYRAKAVLVPENAVDEQEVAAAPREAHNRPLRVAFVGRLVPLKGVRILIEAFVRVADDGPGRLVLDIVGDGPERPSLERLAAGRSDVRFHGALSRSAALDVLRSADVLGFPSIREFGGGAVVEAMACGAVPIIADHGGPRDLVPPNTGFRVPVTSRESLVDGMSHAIRRATNDRTTLALMSDACIHHVRTTLTWSARARQLLQIYQTINSDRRRTTSKDSQPAPSLTPDVPIGATMTTGHSGTHT